MENCRKTWSNWSDLYFLDVLPNDPFSGTRHSAITATERVFRFPLSALRRIR